MAPQASLFGKSSLHCWETAETGVPWAWGTAPDQQISDCSLGGGARQDSPLSIVLRLAGHICSGHVGVADPEGTSTIPPTAVLSHSADRSAINATGAGLQTYNWHRWENLRTISRHHLGKELNSSVVVTSVRGGLK